MKTGVIGHCAHFVICVLFYVLATALLSYRATAAVEIGENYVMYDFCEYDGDSSLPYGKGSNANCYYPKSENADYVFPEVYTWTMGSLHETDNGVLLGAMSEGTTVSMTIDKVPEIYRQSVQRHLKYLHLRIKANVKGENTITFKSLGSTYVKNYSVNYTGEWQTIVLDLSGTDGWTKKNSDGTYSAVTSSPWENKHFGTDGFGIFYNSFGSDIKSQILIKYYAFSDKADITLETGKLMEYGSYINGYDDGLFHGSDVLTRAQGCMIAARLICKSDEIPESDTDITSVFTDVSKDDYYYNAAALLFDLGCLDIYGSELSPDSAMTASELASVIISGKMYNADSGAGMDFAVASLMMDTDDSFIGFSESKKLSRVQACMLVNALTGRRTDITGLSPFADVAESSVGFNDILSASMTTVTKEYGDGSVKLVSSYKTPDYRKTASVISQTDKRTQERITSIRNSVNTVTTPGEKTYYVSPKGNDSNSGTSPESPWKTLKKVNAVGFTAGSTVLFERGSIFRGQVIVRNGVTYSAYGTGEKPRFYGSPENGAQASMWTLVDGTDNVWMYQTPMPDCGSVVFNDGEYMSVKDIPSYKSGAYYHRNTSKVYDYRTDISTDLGIFCDNANKLSEACTLYMRCDSGNPGALFDSIEFLPRMNVFSVTSSDKGAVIDNFTIMYTGAHGIGAGTVTGLTVTNCEIAFIGGSIQNYNSGGGTMPVRYGNGVEIYGGCDGYIVENNYIHQVYDAGITHQLGSNAQQKGVQKNIRYADNIIESCSYSIEYFLGAPTNGAPDRYMENVVIENNIMRYAGFGFGNQRTDRLCMCHIKSGSSANKVSEGFVVRNNIFDRSREMLINITAEESEYLPVFENNTYIQYPTTPETPCSTFGIYGERDARLRFFSGDIENTMRITGFEQIPKVYFAKKDYLYDID